MEEASGSQSNTVETKEHPDLYRRSVKGGCWVSLLQLVINLLSFVKIIIIANFFLLEDLGIISIALMMMEILSTFTQTGFDTALVQKKENIHSYLDTAWTAGLVKGVILFLILYFAAPFLASIRVTEDKVALTISILRAMGICFLIRGIQNIGIIYFQKELQFRKVFMLTLASTLTDIVLSVTFIFFFRSIWGVIGARILSEAVHCAGGYILSPYRPRFGFEYTRARELWKFGKWIYGQGILGYFLEMGDNIFVWFYLGLPQLALYKYAYNFTNMPATHIAQVISTVSFPAYSKIQNDISRLREAYLKIIRLTVSFAIPASFLIFILGPDFVKLFLKSDLHPMILALQILALKGLLKATGSARGPLYIAMGKPDIAWHFQWMRLAILAISIYPLTMMWGIVGTSVSTVLVNVIVNPIALIVSSRILKCPMLDMLKQSFLPLISSILMLVFLLVLKAIYVEHMTYTLFFCFAFSGGFIYLTVLWILDKFMQYEHFQLLWEQIGIFRKIQQ